MQIAIGQILSIDPHRHSSLLLLKAILPLGILGQRFGITLEVFFLVACAHFVYKSGSA